MKKMLITGASGFIGSHTIEEALSRGLQVIAFDRYRISPSNPAWGIYQNDNVSWYLGDIRDFNAINGAIEKADYAVNLAGILGTQETINRPVPSIETNVIGAVNFLEACKPSKFHKVQGVQIGVGNYWMNNSYSITKDTAVRFTHMYNKEHGTKIAMIRGLNAYGPRQKSEPVRKIIPTFVKLALAGEDITVYGDGSQIMDMIYVKDLARILVDAATYDSDNENFYNTLFDAGTGRETTVNWIAEQVIEVVESMGIGKGSKITYLPMRPGEPEHSVVRADPEKFLDDYELTPFEEGIKTTVEWYKEHE